MDCGPLLMPLPQQDLAAQRQDLLGDCLSLGYLVYNRCAPHRPSPPPHTHAPFSCCLLACPALRPVASPHASHCITQCSKAAVPCLHASFSWTSTALSLTLLMRPAHPGLDA